MRWKKEKLAMYLGWFGFLLTLAGSFLPWGTYETTWDDGFVRPPSYETRWVSGLASGWGFLLVVGCVVVLAGLLGSTVEASKITIMLLGVGGLIIIITAGLFISSYYERYVYVYLGIRDLWFGSFVTLIGGACELLAALLFTRHVRTKMITRA